MYNNYSFSIVSLIILQHIEVTKLRPLQDLSNFSMEGNPMASLEHSQLFVIFQLRTLNCLDGKKISEEQREMADKRFAQGKCLHFNIKYDFILN